MKLTILILCFVGFINASHIYNGYRPRRSYPHQTMMFSGFYGKPSIIPGTMTAFATKDTVMSNTFTGDHSFMDGFIPQEESQPDLTETSQDEATIEEDEEEPIITTTLKPKEPKAKSPKRKYKPSKPQIDEEEEDERESFPFSRRNHPGDNVFFPIIFGSRGSSTRSGEYDGGYPGSATAIANAFSTGKGGVASSHATAYGDPYISMFLRNGGNFKRKNFNPKSQD